MTHPHRDLIIKLLDDPTLEVVGKSGLKVSIAHVVSYPEFEFRLLEKPKPDVVYHYTKAHLLRFGRTEIGEDDVLKVTFSADFVLKNAEVI